MLVDGRAQPSDLVPDPDADRPAVSRRPRCTQDMHQYRFAPQIACQLSTVAAARSPPAAWSIAMTM